MTGLLHKDGAISMARGAPDSATSGWFICINDQPSLDFGGARNPDGQGFAAFGRVVSGMDVVRKIQAAPSSSDPHDQHRGAAADAADQESSRSRASSDSVNKKRAGAAGPLHSRLRRRYGMVIVCVSAPHAVAVGELNWSPL